ncbi:MAG: phosphoribosyltransferase family protein [Betaproteobacteria bacterium]
MIIHLDCPAQGDIAFRRFTFPDGQPHIEFDAEVLRLAAAKGPIEMIGAIKSGGDLLNMALAFDAVRSALPESRPLSLNISYLLGARMDRRIASGQPASLTIVAGIINSFTSGLAHVRVLDPHSSVLLAELHRAAPLHPDTLIAYALSRLEHEEGKPPVVVIPDAGAVPRTTAILARLNAPHAVARCTKKRDSQTGKLSGFQLAEGDVAGRTAIIVDDICDGGGTFSGIASVLREHGAQRVYLCVTHGIFSKGLAIAGIDGIFSTDSYATPVQADYDVSTDAVDDAILIYRLEEQTRLVLMTRFMERALQYLKV